MAGKKDLFHKLLEKYPWAGRFVRRLTLIIPDKQYVSWQYKRHMRQKINWDNPVTFNEKLQWMKIYWRDPIATQCADKFGVRDYVKKAIGDQYLTRLYGVYNNVDQIILEELPNQFVLKATHGSSMNVICPDKSKINWASESTKLKNWLKTNYYFGTREWVYKDIVPRIICEEYLGDDPIDYKLYCFHGEPKYWFVCTNRSSGVNADYFELNWEKAPFHWIYPPSNKTIEKPKLANEMIELARKLSKPFPFVRVDFYEVNGKVYFGELTFFHGSGLGWYEPFEYNKILGQMLKLPIVE